MLEARLRRSRIQRHGAGRDPLAVPVGAQPRQHPGEGAVDPGVARRGGHGAVERAGGVVQAVLGQRQVAQQAVHPRVPAPGVRAGGQQRRGPSHLPFAKRGLGGGKPVGVPGEAALDLAPDDGERRAPVAGAFLPHEAHRGIPGRVAPGLQPAPVGGDGEHHPAGPAERAREMADRVVVAHHHLELLEHRGGGIQRERLLGQRRHARHRLEEGEEMGAGEVAKPLRPGLGAAPGDRDARRRRPGQRFLPVAPLPRVHAEAGGRRHGRRRRLEQARQVVETDREVVGRAVLPRRRQPEQARQSRQQAGGRLAARDRGHGAARAQRRQVAGELHGVDVVFAGVDQQGFAVEAPAVPARRPVAAGIAGSVLQRPRPPPRGPAFGIAPVQQQQRAVQPVKADILRRQLGGAGGRNRCLAGQAEPAQNQRKLAQHSRVARPQVRGRAQMPGGLVEALQFVMQPREAEMAVGAAGLRLQHPLIERRCALMVAGGQQFGGPPGRFFKGRGVHGTPSGVAPGRRKGIEYLHKVSGLAEGNTSMKRSGMAGGGAAGG